MVPATIWRSRPTLVTLMAALSVVTPTGQHLLFFSKLELKTLSLTGKLTLLLAITSQLTLESCTLESLAPRRHSLVTLVLSHLLAVRLVFAGI